MFLGDEVNALYRPHEYPTRKRCTHIVAELAHIAKHHGWGAVLTGSAAQLSNVVFNHHQGAWGVDTGNGRYPDVNSGVYIMASVQPIRDPTKLAEYYKARYPGDNRAPSGGDMFMCTGGVGRAVERLHDAEGGVATLKQRVRDKVLNAMKANPAFKALCVLFMSQDHGNGRWYAALQHAACIDGLDLDFLQDQSSVFINEKHARVELLYPCAMDVIKDTSNANTQARQDYCFSVALHVWEEKNVFKEAELYALAHAGVAILEAPFANIKICRAADVFTTRRTTDRLECPIDAGKQLGRDVAIEELAGYGIVQVANETGIDGFSVVPAAADDEYSVDFLQVKLGYVHRDRSTGEIVPNELPGHEVATARRHVWRKDARGVYHPNASRAKGNSVAGIIAKGEIGVDKVMSMLRTVYPTTTFTVNAFYLLTSKVLSGPAAALAEDANFGCPGGVPPAGTNFENRDWSITALSVICDEAFGGTCGVMGQTPTCRVWVCERASCVAPVPHTCWPARTGRRGGAAVRWRGVLHGGILRRYVREGTATGSDEKVAVFGLRLGVVIQQVATVLPHNERYRIHKHKTNGRAHEPRILPDHERQLAKRADLLNFPHRQAQHDEATQLHKSEQPNPLQCEQEVCF